MDPHSSYWKHELKLPKTGFRLKGHSRSTEMTCFYIPELCFYCDAGVHSYFSGDHIFVTHGHGDHIQSINGILKSQNIERSKQPIPIYCPQEISKMLTKYIESFFQVNANNPYLKCHKIVNIIGLSPSERLPLKIKNRNYLMETFKCIHSVPTLGFGLIEVREKLKEELIGKSQTEIISLKKEGIPITNSVEVPLFCYLGDTTHAVFEETKIFDYPTIIVECSFLYDDDLQEASKRKHMHWLNLKSIIGDHPNCLFVLIHFSLRYSDHDIEKFFSDKLMKNMVIWIDSKLICEDNLL